MRKLGLFIIFIFGVAAANAQSFSFVYDGLTRNYFVHLPAGYNASTQYPLVFNFHGYTSNASQQMAYSMMNATADANHFIVVYPDGINNSWNVGFGLGNYGTGVDDVGFVNALIDTMLTNYSVNAQRVYACGMSNGGYLSHRLACELENRIAAVASVTGLLTDSTAAHCNTSRRVPVMQVHGTTDPVVPYNGGVQSYGVEETLNYWLGDNQCPVPGDTVPVPDTNTSDSSTADRIWYQNCEDGSEVLFYKVYNGGHTWPGGLIDIAQYGNTNRDFNASQEIWNFFNRFSLSGPLSVEPLQDDLQLLVYPNPAVDFVRFQVNEPVISCTILNCSGQVQRIVTNAGSGIPVYDLASGIYFLQVQTASGTHFAKLVRQ